MIIDTHAHLNTKDFDHDLEAVLKRAQAHDVSKIFVIGMDKASSILAIKMAEDHEMLYATVGLHPGYVDEGTPDYV
jgi:TatD DNase family protein